MSYTPYEQGFDEWLSEDLLWDAQDYPISRRCCLDDEQKELTKEAWMAAIEWYKKDLARTKE